MNSIRRVDKYGNIEYVNENGQYHREDGPAFEENSSEYKSYWINGKIHREDGPARILCNGDYQYWLNDKQYSKEDWDLKVIKLKLKRIKDL